MHIGESEVDQQNARFRTTVRLMISPRVGEIDNRAVSDENASIHFFVVDSYPMSFKLNEFQEAEHLVQVFLTSG